MAFTFFRSRNASEGSGSSAPDSVLADAGMETQTPAEQLALQSALHAVLRRLPQSNSGRENLRLLCDEILNATRRLRFIWVGFREGGAESVKPYAAVGDCVSESTDWDLPASCFQSFGLYSQVAPAFGGTEQGASLFRPWRADPDRCSAHCALAIPLRSENAGLQGMIVFYADSVDYFSRTGLAAFEAFCNVAEIVWKQSNLIHMLTQAAQEDPLTGLATRRHIMARLEKEMERADSNGSSLSILVCKLEGLGKLNGLYGTQAADAILAAFAKEVVNEMHPFKLCGRWTGTELLAVLPGADGKTARQIAGKLREHFQNSSITVRSWSVRLSLAIGVAAHSKFIIGLDDLIQQAHQGMRFADDEMANTLPLTSEPPQWR